MSSHPTLVWQKRAIHQRHDIGSVGASKPYEPDFVCRIGNRCVVGDAKYKRLHLSDTGRLLPVREDVFQVVAYMAMLNASAGFLVYAACDPSKYATRAPSERPDKLFPQHTMGRI